MLLSNFLIFNVQSNLILSHQIHCQRQNTFCTEFFSLTAAGNTPLLMACQRTFNRSNKNIRNVFARSIFDSRGNPTVEVDLITDLGLFRAAVPSGASTGIFF